MQPQEQAITERPIYIKEFARVLGVYPDTIRNYQERGILPDRRNPVNNYRIFTNEDVDVMLKLLAGKITEQELKARVEQMQKG